MLPAGPPRGPSAEEEVGIKEIRDMWQLMNRQMGDRSEGDVTTSDIKEMLMEMGGDWTKNLGALEMAVNVRDQGV